MSDIMDRIARIEERAEKMTDEELVEAQYDAAGESGACGDGDCGCHLVPHILLDELEYRGLEPRS